MPGVGHFKQSFVAIQRQINIPLMKPTIMNMVSDTVMPLIPQLIISLLARMKPKATPRIGPTNGETNMEATKSMMSFWKNPKTDIKLAVRRKNM